MFNLDNIDLKKEHSSLKEEVKALKSYVWQMVEELKFRLDDKNLYGEEEEADTSVTDGLTEDVETLYTKLKKIGTQKAVSNSAGTSVATNKYKAICALSLEAGTWLVHGTVMYGGSSSGDRCAIINSTEAWNRSAMQKIGAAPGGTVADATGIVSLTETKTYYLVAWQNSGSSITATGDMSAVRIK